MPENFAETHRNIGFNDAVTFELQQTPGMLYPLVGSTANYAGEIKHRIANRFGHLEMEEQTGRNEDTNLTDIDSVARFIKPRRAADLGVLLDKNDQKVTQVNLGDPIAREVAAAARRYHDDSWLLGYYANAYAGEAGDTAVPFDAANTVAHGGVGLTLAKLIALRQAMALKDNNFDEEKPVILLTPRQESDLLNIAEYKNSDYQDGHPLVNGEIRGWMGFRFVRFNPDSSKAYKQGSLTKAATTRKLPAFFPSGLHRGVWTEFFGRISERDDKKYNQQVYGEARSAVVRVDEAKCFILECTE